MSERPDLAGLMRDHEYALQMRGGAICSCGHVPTVDPATLQTQQDYHRAHLAVALNAAIEAWLADEGTRERMWEAVAAVRDASPRTTDDADSWDVLDAALAALTNPTTTEDHR